MRSGLITRKTDTNVTHYSETPIKQGFQGCSTIEWE